MNKRIAAWISGSVPVRQSRRPAIGSLKILFQLLLIKSNDFVVFLILVLRPKHKGYFVGFPNHVRIVIINEIGRFSVKIEILFFLALP